ncbi:hypothetical protein [Polyangium aurulentum]|uniref:hypothetical protein n=1 Tax=Polyangium aurulentum TaxID=2567896 RepID=UPI00200D782D|nr:hypothetical protein [Polyangium aurulentum]UQA60451.1 hypothetical protein E8A73_008250 [Polyangium aurulentum]
MIFKEDIGRDRIADVMRAMGLVPHPTNPAEGMFWQIWMTPDKKSAVHYVDDLLTKVRYFSVRGKKAGALTKKLRQQLPIWTRDELLKHALFTLMKGSEEDIARIAMEVAAEMDEYDAASAGVLAAFLKMDERSTRLAGALAFRSRPFPLFHSTAEQLAADPDPEIAVIGKALLARIIELHGPSAPL